ncbi:dienelactone hydrolase family protein [Arthrobacter sp. FW306-06-A]|uniref:dienelactone hydrolase family protein n=1 Tax=Arthrobacter sp. FW306-06-A TaxID=2879621 RepID=UPI001F351E9C|nr:dienelactone hydrolase family protein [Arthrobacter sp. FW306-06-A]UKA72121.1 dienelactone hydrolase family protein [Arthrobacter sp. FW306-06-A]
MGNMMTLGNAETSVQAYVSEPAGTPKGGLVVVHEVWGLVGHTRDVADRFAAEGYLAVAPDLLSGAGGVPDLSGELQEAAFDPQQRSNAQPRLRKHMAPIRSPEYAKHAVAALHVCFDHLEGVAGLTGRVAATGFCLGGTYTFSLAVAEPRLRAAVPFYGHAEFKDAELRAINCPVLAFYGQQDAALMEELPGLKVRMRAAGVDFEAVVYPGAGHAFFNDTNKYTYNAEAAADSWTRTLAFLERSLEE